MLELEFGVFSSGSLKDCQGTEALATRLVQEWREHAKAIYIRSRFSSLKEVDNTPLLYSLEELIPLSLCTRLQLNKNNWHICLGLEIARVGTRPCSKYLLHSIVPCWPFFYPVDTFQTHDDPNTSRNSKMSLKHYLKMAYKEAHLTWESALRTVERVEATLQPRRLNLTKLM